MSDLIERIIGDIGIDNPSEVVRTIAEIEDKYTKRVISEVMYRLCERIQDYYNLMGLNRLIPNESYEHIKYFQECLDHTMKDMISYMEHEPCGPREILLERILTTKHNLT